MRPLAKSLARQHPPEITLPRFVLVIKDPLLGAGLLAAVRRLAKRLTSDEARHMAVNFALFRRDEVVPAPHDNTMLTICGA